MPPMKCAVGQYDPERKWPDGVNISDKAAIPSRQVNLWISFLRARPGSSTPIPGKQIFGFLRALPESSTLIPGNLSILPNPRYRLKFSYVSVDDDETRNTDLSFSESVKNQGGIVIARGGDRRLWVYFRSDHAFDLEKYTDPLTGTICLCIWYSQMEYDESPSLLQTWRRLYKASSPNPLLHIKRWQWYPQKDTSCPGIWLSETELQQKIQFHVVRRHWGSYQIDIVDNGAPMRRAVIMVHSSTPVSEMQPRISQALGEQIELERMYGGPLCLAQTSAASVGKLRLTKVVIIPRNPVAPFRKLHVDVKYNYNGITYWGVVRPTEKAEHFIRPDMTVRELSMLLLDHRTGSESYVIWHVCSKYAWAELSDECKKLSEYDTLNRCINEQCKLSLVVWDSTVPSGVTPHNRGIRPYKTTTHFQLSKDQIEAVLWDKSSTTIFNLQTIAPEVFEEMTGFEAVQDTESPPDEGIHAPAAIPRSHPRPTDLRSLDRVQILDYSVDLQPWRPSFVSAGPAEASKQQTNESGEKGKEPDVSVSSFRRSFGRIRIKEVVEIDEVKRF